MLDQANTGRTAVVDLELSTEDEKALAELAGILVGPGAARLGRIVVNRGPAPTLDVGFEVTADHVSVWLPGPTD
ncbi:MAG: hypothetical protein ACRDRD_07825 [Pseudonocardiaceae bacterium]